MPKKTKPILASTLDLSSIQLNMVVVKWHDARFFPGTYTKNDCNKHNMCLFESLGYIISDDETIPRIAGEQNNEGEYRDITLIPTGSIISITRLCKLL